MIDTDVTGATVMPSSTFNRLPPGFGDPDPTDLDRLAAGLDYLTVCHCKPATGHAGQQSAAEAVGERERFGDAERTAGGQL